VIAVINYKAGNLASVASALSYLGFQYRVTRKAEEIAKAEKVIVPGVGSAGQAMGDLQNRGIDEVLREVYASGTPFMGICLGSQIILERSEEHNTACLGLLAGMVRRFPSPLLSDQGETLKVPHIGWNRVRFIKAHPVFRDIPRNGEFYFAHSYFPLPDSEESVIGITDYGIPFASVVGEQNLIAVQFHPEKSGSIGLIILKNFCQWHI
jgi:imidazole glycerol-phosphate synthase subunit HisH